MYGTARRGYPEVGQLRRQSWGLTGLHALRPSLPLLLIIYISMVVVIVHEGPCWRASTMAAVGQWPE